MRFFFCVDNNFKLWIKYFLVRFNVNKTLKYNIPYQHTKLPLRGTVALRLRGGYYSLYILLKLLKSYESVKQILSPILTSIIKEHKKRCYRSNIFLNNQISKAYASSISETTPEPTVLPPSRIAKRRPFSIAIGVISSTSIFTLSPGIHISVPSGSVITPVTSVVLK